MCYRSVKSKNLKIKNSLSGQLLFRMKPWEIDRFVRTHTSQFETELQKRRKLTVKHPSPAFEKTAEINIKDTSFTDASKNQEKVIFRKTHDLATYIIESIDNGDKITLVKMLDLMRRLVNELHVGGLPKMAFTNILTEMVDEYNLLFGVKTRQLLQKVVYAMMELPGDQFELMKLRSDISQRLERELLKVGGSTITLQYMLPLDDDHWYENPPLRRVPSTTRSDKATQTVGEFQNDTARDNIETITA